jgi:mono/diheme cytochrome c family protein
MLKPFLFLCAVITLVLGAPVPAPTLAAGSGLLNASGGTAASANPVKPTAASQAKAKKLYAMDCAMCHGDTGNGKTDLATDMKLTLLDWSDPKALAAKSDQDLFDAIRKGKDKMPAEDAERAKDDEVWNLVFYIREMSKAGSNVAANPSN